MSGWSITDAIARAVQAAQTFDIGGESTLERAGERWSVNNSAVTNLDAAIALALSFGADPARCEAVRIALIACDAEGDPC